MFCHKCPTNSIIQRLINFENGGEDDAREIEQIRLKLDELKAKCCECSREAQRQDKRTAQVQEHCMNARSRVQLLEESGTGNGKLLVDLDYLMERQPGEFDVGCTAELDFETETILRKAVSAISAIDCCDAGNMYGLLNNDGLFVIRRRSTQTRREFAQSMRRALAAIAKAKKLLTTKASREAAKEFRETLTRTIDWKDAPLLIGLMQGLNISTIGVKIGLELRASAHARLKRLLRRFPAARQFYRFAYRLA